MNYFVCKSKRLANFLMEQNIKCEKVDKDRANPNFMIFLFKRSEELSKALDKWDRDKNTYGIA
jgi:hypothetical protein